MKLTQKIKDKIDNWFNSKTPEEVVEIGKKYGLDKEPTCICHTDEIGFCAKHHTDWI